MSTTTAQVASSVSAVTLLAGNPSRVKAPNCPATIVNDSTANLFVLLGTGVPSSTNYTYKMGPTSSGIPFYYEVPTGYSGPIQGIWDAANGFAYVTEFN